MAGINEGKKPSILFLMISYPNVSVSGNMYTDLVGEFVKRNYDITIVAPADHGKETALSMEGTTQVLRVKTMKLFNVHPIQKGLANVLLPYQFERAINKFFAKKQFDLIIIPTPPITFVDIASKLRKKFSSKVYLILRDIFPQNARDLGMIKNSLIFNYFRRKEEKLYKVSDAIGCMSQGNIDFVIKHNPGIDQRKLHILQNWQTIEPYTGKDESIKAKYGLEGKFVAIFGGNIGLPQKVENIAALAKIHRDKEDVVFFIVGRGNKKSHLEQLIAEEGLTNVIVKEMLPRRDYEELVKNADLGLISLSDKFTIPNIPSKTASYYSAKIPVYAIIDAHTDFGQLLETAQAGFWSVAGDTKSYKERFDKLYFDKQLRTQMGENGYQYLLKNLSSEIAYNIVMKEYERLNG